MSNTFSPTQRRKLEELVNRRRATRDVEVRDKGFEVKYTICRELARKAGCMPDVERVIHMARELDDERTTLSKFGFEILGNTVRLSDSGQQKYGAEFDKTFDEKMKPYRDDSKYDRAILAIWTEGSEADAKKHIERLLN
jgi:hypothetical protein